MVSGVKQRLRAGQALDVGMAEGSDGGGGDIEQNIVQEI
jgi:hypothetical protein